MTTSAAIRFIEALATDHALRERLRARGRGIRLEDVAILAAEAGFHFTADELRQAFVQDWHMRRRFFSSAATD